MTLTPTSVPFTGDGTRTNFAFNFDYLRREFVKATVNGVPTTFTFFNSTTAYISPAPAAGAEIVIRRETDQNALVTYVTGSLLNAPTLNLSQIQAIHIAQEAWWRTGGDSAGARDYHQFLSLQLEAINFEVEAVDAALSYWSAMGGAVNYGPDGVFPPTLSVKGPGANIPGSFAAKGERGFWFGNSLGKLFEIVSGTAGVIANRIPKLRPGSTTAGDYASLDAEGGLDLKDNGSTILRIIGGAGIGTAILSISNQIANLVSLSTVAGKTLMLAGGLGTQILSLSRLSRTVAVSTLATGGNFALSPYVGVNVLNAASFPLATLTFTLPAAPADGETVHISCRGAVTAATFASAGGHAVIGAPTTVNSTTPISFVFISAVYGWQRL
jgi:hypothetical protein